MNGHTAMPTVTFGEGTTYDTLTSVLSGWCFRFWLEGGVIIVARLDGDGSEPDTLALTAWDHKTQDYSRPLQIETDLVTKMEVL